MFRKQQDNITDWSFMIQYSVISKNTADHIPSVTQCTFVLCIKLHQNALDVCVYGKK